MFHVEQCKMFHVEQCKMFHVEQCKMFHVEHHAAALGAGGSGYGGGGLRQLLWGQGAVATAAEGYGSCL